MFCFSAHVSSITKQISLNLYQVYTRWRLNKPIKQFVGRDSEKYMTILDLSWVPSWVPATPIRHWKKTFNTTTLSDAEGLNFFDSSEPAYLG